MKSSKGSRLIGALPKLQNVRFSLSPSASKFSTWKGKKTEEDFSLFQFNSGEPAEQYNKIKYVTFSEINKVNSLYNKDQWQPNDVSARQSHILNPPERESFRCSSIYTVHFPASVSATCTQRRWWNRENLKQWKDVMDLKERRRLLKILGTVKTRCFISLRGYAEVQGTKIFQLWRTSEVVTFKISESNETP